MKILILTVAIGSGHLSASRTLEYAIKQKHADAQIVIVDTLKYINPLIDSLVVGIYLSIVKNISALYAMIYDQCENGKTLSGISKAINCSLSSKIEKLIKNENPHIVICTHPFSLQMVGSLKSKGEISAHVISMPTDYAIHGLWTHKYVDTYLVASDHMKHDMVCRGVDAKVIVSTGLPVHHSFYKENPCREDSNTALPTILIMGGSLGLGNISDVFTQLVDSQRKLNIICICGHNKKLQKKLMNISKTKCTENKNINIIGYTDNVAKYMAISDIVFTKPGGITVTEAITLQTPLILLDPIPGHEEENANFLVNSGAAYRMNRRDSAESLLSLLLDNPEQLASIKKSLRALAKPNAISDIMSIIEEKCSISFSVDVSSSKTLSAIQQKQSHDLNNVTG